LHSKTAFILRTFKSEVTAALNNLATGYSSKS